MAMSRRSFLCLAAAAAAYCCLALLVRPVHGGRSGTGLLGGAAGSRRDNYRLPVPEPRLQVTQAQEEKEQPRGARTTKAKLSWSPAAPEVGRVRTELRSVPGGPDPLHHHGSPRRPEQESAAP